MFYKHAFLVSIALTLNTFDENWPKHFEVLMPYICYAPNFEEVEGAYWFGSVRAVSQSVSLSVMREHPVRNR